ncbi:MAG: hypothetical protein MI924_31735, partial [Chloroflexales bacterium]|nr:hypothetical protein [Chloroflexales bacterium]
MWLLKRMENGEGRRPSPSPQGNPAGSVRPREPNLSRLDPSAGDLIGRLYGWGGGFRCDVWMAAHAHGPLAAHG